MNQEPSQNRGPRPTSRRRRHRGSGPQEIIRVIPEGEWLGYRRRTPGHFSLAGGLWGHFILMGRVRDHENRPAYLDSAAKCPKIPENPLAEHLPDRVRFGAFSFVSVRNAFFGEITQHALYLCGFQSERGSGLGGTRTHNQRLKRALLYH